MSKPISITPVHHAKADLRQQVRARLNALTPDQQTAASRDICSRLREHASWQSATTVLCFAPLPDEADVWPLVTEGLATGKLIGLPRFAPEHSGYVASQVRDLERDVRIGRFQIREPLPGCPELVLSRFDLILVPGVAFDKHGQRLGRGQGYYDRWLREVHRATLCGVAFREQLLEEIPAASHDVRMHLVVTPDEVIQAG